METYSTTLINNNAPNDASKTNNPFCKCEEAPITTHVQR